MDARRKRLLFRARHRGMNENDILVGRYAEDNLSLFSNEQLDQFELLLEVPDNDLFDWITGKAEVPPEFDTPIMAGLKARAPKLGDK